MEEQKYKLIYESGSGEVVEKKSRFIANVYNVTDEEEVTSYINRAKKKYWDARHNCYAFVIGDNNQLQRCSDDGEPSGTAGRPILEILLANDIHNCLIIVTRYFGGTLLGTGGLVRAYQGAAKAGIDNAVLASRVPGHRVTIRTDYNGLGRIQYIANQMQLEVSDIEYTDVVRIILMIPTETVEEFTIQVTEATSAKAVFEENKVIDIIRPIIPVNVNK